MHWKYRSAIEGRLPKFLRLFGYLSALALLLFVLQARTVYGHVAQSLLVMGEELAPFAGTPGTQNALVLNGERIYLASRMMDLPVAEALDQFETSCRNQGGDFSSLLQELPASVQKSARLSWPQRLGILRVEDANRGVVACLARKSSDTLQGFSKKMTQFLQEGDLSVLGDIRYARVEKKESGRLHVLTSWTEGSFRILKLFPPTGDAPGADLPGVPRPSGARRLLTATRVGEPYGVYMYTSAQSPKTVLEELEKAMPPFGWKALPVSPKAAAYGRAFSLQREGRDLFVSVGGNAQGSTVSLIEMKSSL